MDDTEYSDERWLTIPFAPNYSVSDLGRVKRTALWPAYRFGKMLKVKVDTNGYLAVCLYAGGRKLSIQVHTAVCRAFHGECPPDKSEVGHRDGDRTNARADNLRWVSRVENSADRIAHGRSCRGTENYNAKLTPLKVEAIRILSATMGVRKIAEVVGISKSQVSNVLRGATCWTNQHEDRLPRAYVSEAPC